MQFHTPLLPRDSQIELSRLALFLVLIEYLLSAPLDLVEAHNSDQDDDEADYAEGSDSGHGPVADGEVVFHADHVEHDE